MPIVVVDINPAAYFGSERFVQVRQTTSLRNRQSNHSFPNCHVDDGVESSLGYQEAKFVPPLPPPFPLVHNESEPVEVNIPPLNRFIIFFIVGGAEDFLFGKPSFQMTCPEGRLSVDFHCRRHLIEIVENVLVVLGRVHRARCGNTGFFDSVSYDTGSVSAFKNSSGV